MKRPTECWCVHNDPCGICCVVFTYGLLFFSDYVVMYAVLPPFGAANYILIGASYIGMSILAMVSHFRCMTTNPGAVPHEYQPNNLLAHEKGGELPMCSRCNGFKPPRAHHCSQCDRCILKMDHHCPWVNNCVGANNQKHFVLFVMYTCLNSGYALLLLGFRAMYVTSPPAHVLTIAERRAQSGDPGGKFLLMALLFFEAILFGLFTLAMFTEQIASIIADQTGIERIKNDWVPVKRSLLHNLSETFGRPVSLLWLLPTPVKFNGQTWLELLPMECEV